MLGTSGTSSSEIKQFLDYTNGLDECTINDIYQSIFISLQQQSCNEVEISLYTKLFPQDGFPILESYLNIADTYYFTNVQNLDYFNSPQIATDTINEWVSNSTKGKIEKLFDEPLTSDTRFVIVNVIFFNGTWENKFSPYATKNGTFEAESGNIPIPMMNSEMTVPYLNDIAEGLEMIALPYVGNCFSMFILKPTGVKTLKEIENDMNSSKLDDLINRMNPTTVNVTIPRMKLDLDLDLKKVLKETFGINEIFSPGVADFTRMTTAGNLHISKIIHKAILEVGEEGTIAVAATGVVGGTTSILIPTPTKFILDKPSLLFIRDNDTGLVLFWARVMEPKPIWE